MAQFVQAGRPASLVTTTPSATITDIVAGSFIQDPELHMHYGGTNRFPRVTVGNANAAIRVRTTDIRAFTLFTKGMVVAGAVYLCEGPMTGVAVDGTLTQQTAAIGGTISSGVVTQSVELNNSNDGQPAEFFIEITATIKESDGTAPTVTPDVTA